MGKIQQRATLTSKSIPNCLEMKINKVLQFIPKLISMILGTMQTNHFWSTLVKGRSHSCKSLCQSVVLIGAYRAEQRCWYRSAKTQSLFKLFILLSIKISLVFSCHRLQQPYIRLKLQEELLSKQPPFFEWTCIWHRFVGYIASFKR